MSGGREVLGLEQKLPLVPGTVFLRNDQVQNVEGCWFGFSLANLRKTWEELGLAKFSDFSFLSHYGAW